MKLCRFELKSAPGEIRSGMVYSGKIYETDGGESVAVHEADQVRPLSPVGRPSSLRFFRMEDGTLPATTEDRVPCYFHGNTGAIFGPSQIIPLPPTVAHLDFESYVIAVVGSDGINIPEENGDDFILGYTLGTFLIARDWQREEKALGAGFGRSFDLGGVIGPVITTPDDLDESLHEEIPGRKYDLSVVTRVNSVENGRGQIHTLPISFAAMVAAASEAGPIRTGDLLALGPIAISDGPVFLESGDDVQVSVEHLGTLSLKIG